MVLCLVLLISLVYQTCSAETTQSSFWVDEEITSNQPFLSHVNFRYLNDHDSNRESTTPQGFWIDEEIASSEPFHSKIKFNLEETEILESKESRYPGPWFGGDYARNKPFSSHEKLIEEKESPNRIIFEPYWKSTEEPMENFYPTFKPYTASVPYTTTERKVPPIGFIHYSPEGCPCMRTRQFDPVCGTDLLSYANIALLNCHIKCGKKVSLRYRGVCRRNNFNMG